jgi:hypothetical protein
MHAANLSASLNKRMWHILILVFVFALGRQAFSQTADSFIQFPDFPTGRMRATVNALAVQRDGKVLAGKNTGAPQEEEIVRFYSDGTTDVQDFIGGSIYSLECNRMEAFSVRVHFRFMALSINASSTTDGMLQQPRHLRWTRMILFGAWLCCPTGAF